MPIKGHSQITFTEFWGLLTSFPSPRDVDRFTKYIYHICLWSNVDIWILDNSPPVPCQRSLWLAPKNFWKIRNALKPFWNNEIKGLFSKLRFYYLSKIFTYNFPFMLSWCGPRRTLITYYQSDCKYKYKISCYDQIIWPRNGFFCCDHFLKLKPQFQ